MILEISDFNPKHQITLVPGSQITSLTFQDAIKTLIELKTNTTVNILELKHTAKKIEENLEKIILQKNDIVLDIDNCQEKNRSIVLETIELLPSVFESLSKDELGKKAVAL